MHSRQELNDLIIRELNVFSDRFICNLIKSLRMIKRLESVENEEYQRKLGNKKRNNEQRTV